MRDLSLPLILPLLSAVVYVAGALFLKRAGQEGGEAWRMAWITNLISAIVFAPLALLGGTLQPLPMWWQPAVVGLLFVSGQIFTFRALEVGDVSVATPVLGVKIILVALGVTLLLREDLTPSLWAAAGLSTAAIALLNFTRSRHHHHVGLTIVLSGLSAGSYALFDVLVQKWSPGWGIGRFLPVMMGFVALYALGMRQMAQKRSERTPRTARPWLIGAALCMALQGVMFVSAIAAFGQATVANVLYSSRGLWSVVAVWLVGHWFGNTERHLGARILIARLIGAGLLLAAVVLVLLRR